MFKLRLTYGVDSSLWACNGKTVMVTHSNDWPVLRDRSCNRIWVLEWNGRSSYSADRTWRKTDRRLVFQWEDIQDEEARCYSITFLLLCSTGCPFRWHLWQIFNVLFQASITPNLLYTHAEDWSRRQIVINKLAVLHDPGGIGLAGSIDVQNHRNRH